MKLEDFSGLLVYHNKFGQGIIEKLYYKSDVNDYRLIINFNIKTSIFIFPDIFESLLKLENKEAQQYVEKLIKDKKDEQEQERLEKIRLKEEQEKLKKEEYEQFLKTKRKIEYIEQQHLYFKTKHNKEFPYSTFLVYQGKTWEQESKKQILCIHRDYNRKVAFWDIITELKCLDIILHCKGQFFYAISRVTKEAYETDKDDYEENIASYKVDCNYIIFNNPVDLRLFRQDIKDYDEINTPKLSPFNKHGLGNQGYIFPIDRDLAQAFIIEAVKSNYNLLNIEYIKELLELYK